MVRRTAMEYVRDPKAKAPTAVPGTMDLRCPASILGQVGAASKVNGKTAKDTDWELKHGGDGYIGGNGRKVLKADMEYDNPALRLRSIKEHGPMDYRTDMDQKLMLTTEHTKDNG